jgi:UMF1 family MFS transporter
VLAGQLFGWKAGTLATFGVVVTVAAATGGFLSVVIDKWLGARRTVITGMAIVLAGSAALLSIGSAANAGEPFVTINEKLFTAAALLIALGSGPAIAGMRALMAEIAPPDRVTAAFGLYAFSGRATNFVGPLVLGLIVSGTGSLRAGLLVALVFLLIGIGCFITLPADNRSKA